MNDEVLGVSKRSNPEGLRNETTLCIYHGEQTQRNLVHRGYLEPCPTGLAAQNNLVEGFTNRYGIHILVWYEVHETMQSAIAKEKMVKNWKRVWKLALIEKNNPEWQDLYQNII